MTIKRNKSDNYLFSGFVSFDLTQVRVLLLLLWLSEKWANWLLIGKLPPNFFMYIQYVFFIVLSWISIVNWKVCSRFYAEIFISGEFYKYWEMKLLICSSFWFLNHEGETVHFCLCHNWYANDSVSSLCWYVPCIRHFQHWTSLHADVNLICPWSMISCLQNELDLLILCCGVCV